jgi:hypothetical protein
MNVYLEHVAFCAHLRLHAPAMPLVRSGTPHPPSLEYIDPSALGIEGLLLTALVFFAIRAIRGRRRVWRQPAGAQRSRGALRSHLDQRGADQRVALINRADRCSLHLDENAAQLGTVPEIGWAKRVTEGER